MGGERERRAGSCRALAGGPETEAREGNLGFYITGHPLRKYANEVKTTAMRRPARFPKSLRDSMSRSAESYPRFARCERRRATRWASSSSKTGKGSSKCLVFPDTYAKAQSCSIADAPIFVKGKLDNDESTIKILATDIYPMERVKEVLSRTVTIHINVQRAPTDIAEKLQPVIDEKEARPRSSLS